MSREYRQNGTDKNVSSYGKSQSEVPCENSLENIKQYRRKAEIKRKLTAVAVLCAVVIVGAFLCYTKFFKIQKLVVKGECPYTEVEMMEGMGIQKGETLYGKSDKEIKQNVKYNLAFIDSMKISRIWPDTMKVTVFRWRDEIMTIAEAVVKRLFELCNERNLTVNKISNISGITQSTVSDIVNGTTTNAGIATIKKLCDGFEISIREFFNSDLFDDLEQEVK